MDSKPNGHWVYYSAHLARIKELEAKLAELESERDGFRRANKRAIQSEAALAEIQGAVQDAAEHLLYFMPSEWIPPAQEKLRAALDKAETRRAA